MRHKMAGKNKKKKSGDDGLIAQNRKARYEYAIEETIEAGIALLGSEVKSMRSGGGISIVESHAGEKHGEIYLFNTNIPEYKHANQFNHEPKRPRKLLLKKREISKIIGATKQKGVTLVPLKMYFNERGLVKVLLGLGKGKKQSDKRDTEKQRDWQRQKERIMKHEQ